MLRLARARARDIICYNRIGEIKGHYNYVRWMWLRNFKDPRKMISKMVMVEDIPFPLIPDALRIDPDLQYGNFIVGGATYRGADFFTKKAFLTGIERPDFRRYWDIRLGLTRTAFEKFTKLWDDSALKRGGSKLTGESSAKKIIASSPTNIRARF
jgi:hypothetical protein